MSALNRTHASLERDVARDVEFTAVNVTDCANPEMLATRLLEVSRSTVTHGVVVLGWDEVIGQPVGSAARRALS
ncbi:hypothetical protein DEU34_2155 [Microbacterium sp. AG1240]|nr:hypothetical protein DEU34_2155 [Microbacterium sp. AG1240]